MSSTMSAGDAGQRRRSVGWGLPLGVAVALVAAGAFGVTLFNAQALPEGPAPVVWDKTACAHCRMHVGEPGFAAQAQLADGAVLDFDDPGCLARWLDEHASAAIHAIYFHHHNDDRWLAEGQVGFVAMSPTPMGFGFGAVDAATPGALTWQQVRARVQDAHPHEVRP
ncbi:MAG: hypothetical protein IT383_00820 [Deltaproteobacteria bacterium]|nr:hypothetical protein [Deltaproteobacteria bacterium]